MRALLLVALISCSKKTDEAPPAPPAAVVEKSNLACKLLQQDDAKKLAQMEMADVEAHVDPVKTARCTYKNKQPYTTVSLAVSPRGQKMFDEQVALGYFGKDPIELQLAGKALRGQNNLTLGMMARDQYLELTIVPPPGIEVTSAQIEATATTIVGRL